MSSPASTPSAEPGTRPSPASAIHTGVMVHLVPDEGVDDGPVLATATVSIQPSDTLESLTSRVHGVEHRLLVETLATLCTTGANA